MAILRKLPEELSLMAEGSRVPNEPWDGSRLALAICTQRKTPFLPPKKGHNLQLLNLYQLLTMARPHFYISDGQLGRIFVRNRNFKSSTGFSEPVISFHPSF
jgi:hypothetical protein